MKKYKFELVRTSVIKGATQKLESIANEYFENGWEFKSAQYFSEILSFLLVFERNE